MENSTSILFSHRLRDIDEQKYAEFGFERHSGDEVEEATPGGKETNGQSGLQVFQRTRDDELLFGLLVLRFGDVLVDGAGTDEDQGSVPQDFQGQFVREWGRRGLAHWRRWVWRKLSLHFLTKIPFSAASKNLQ